MDKKKLHRYINQFLEGNLTEDSEKELLDWIKQSEDNKNQFLNKQAELSETVITGNTQYSQRWKEIEHQITLKKRNITSVFIRVASVAAAFIFGVILTVVITKQFSVVQNQFVQHNISVPYGAKTNLTLPDGSTVWLNSGTSFSYPSEFGNKRLVTLSGEAFFEVDKQEKPFIVSTPKADIKVLGTSFNVQAYDNETQHTTLVSGSVNIKEKKNNNEIILTPGQQARLVNDRLKANEVETELFTSWKDGKLIFRKEYLPNMVKRLERWYNVKIELENDKRLNKIWFTGTLEMESFSEVLELIKVTSPIDYTYNEKTRTIKIRYK